MSSFVRRAARGGGEGEAEADEVVGGVADDGLVEVADFGFDFALGVADVAVAADPDGRPFWELVAGAGVEPLGELEVLPRT
jgi:hypothetical protein